MSFWKIIQVEKQNYGGVSSCEVSPSITFSSEGRLLRKSSGQIWEPYKLALYFVCMGCTYLSADMNADDFHFIIRRRYYYYYLKYIIIFFFKKYFYYLKDIILKYIPSSFLIDGKKWRFRFGNLFSCLSTRYSCIFGELCKALFLGFRIKM